MRPEPNACTAFLATALDTDLAMCLVRVRPDGTAIDLQEGAPRLRYRDGVAVAKLLGPGEPVTAVVDRRSIAYLAPCGYRLRVHVMSSSFPRLQRNLNTGAACRPPASAAAPVRPIR